MPEHFKSRIKLQVNYVKSWFHMPFAIFRMEHRHLSHVTLPLRKSVLLHSTETSLSMSSRSVTMIVLYLKKKKKLTKKNGSEELERFIH